MGRQCVINNWVIVKCSICWTISVRHDYPGSMADQIRGLPTRRSFSVYHLLRYWSTVSTPFHSHRSWDCLSRCWIFSTSRSNIILSWCPQSIFTIWTSAIILYLRQKRKKAFSSEPQLLFRRRCLSCQRCWLMPEWESEYIAKKVCICIRSQKI